MAINATGQLIDLQGQTIGAGHYGLHVEAIEADGPGVTTLEISIDGQAVSTKRQDCAGGGCTLTDDYVFATADHGDGTHEIRVVASDAVHEQSELRFTVTTETGAPAMVQGLAATPAEDWIELSWHAGNDRDLDHYTILRGETEASLSPVDTVGASATNYVDTSAADGKASWYAIVAVDTGGNASAASDAVSALTGGAAGVAVRDLRAAAAPYDIHLPWEAVNSGDLLGYNVYRKRAGDSDFELLTEVPTRNAQFDDGTLAAGIDVTYRVATVDDDRREGPPVAVSATSRGMRAQPHVSKFVMAVRNYDPVTQQGSRYRYVLVADPFGSQPPIWAPTCGDPLLSSCGWTAYGPVALSPDGNYAVTGLEMPQGGDALAIIDLRTGVQRVVCGDVGRESIPRCVAPSSEEGTGGIVSFPPMFTPDGSHLRYVGTYDQTRWPELGADHAPVYDLPLAGGSPTMVVTPSGVPRNALLTPLAADGSMLLSGEDDAGNQEVMLYAMDGTLRRQVQVPDVGPGGALLGGALLAPGGDSLEWSSDDPPRLLAADLDGQIKRYLTPPGMALYAGGPMSSDGRMLYAGSSDAFSLWASRRAWATPFWYGHPDLMDELSLYSTDIETGDTRSIKLSSIIPLPTGGARQVTDVSGAWYAQSSSTLKLSTTLPSESYLRAGEPLEAEVTATGVNTSVDELRVFAGGRSLDLTSASATAASFRGDTTGMSEGRHAVHAVAGTTSGLERQLSRTLVVDSTAPEAPDEFTSSAEDDSESNALQRPALSSPTLGDGATNPFAVGAASADATRVTVEWTPVTDPRLADGTQGSGLQAVRYRYRRTDGDWTNWQPATDSKSFTASATAFSGTFEVAVTDRAGNRQVKRAHVASATSEIERIANQRWRLDEYHHIVREAERILEDEATAALRRAALRSVVKVLGRLTVAEALLDVLVNADPTGCLDTTSAQAFYDQQGIADSLAGVALKSAAGVGVGGDDGIASAIHQALNAVNEAQGLAEYQRRHTADPCRGLAKRAQVLNVASMEALVVASERVDQLRDQGMRREAQSKAIRVLLRPWIARTRCDEAKGLVAELGSGVGRRNYVVYWSAPPPPDVDVTYIGRSRALDSRCGSHPRERREKLETLVLPRLTSDESRNVEEALITHFGVGNEPPNDSSRRNGQLDNKRHERNRKSPGYCQHLLEGQSILRLNADYWRYSVAHYTRPKSCPSVDGPA